MQKTRLRNGAAFDDLRQSLKEALAYERGHKVDRRVTRLPGPPARLSAAEIRRIRRSLNASQAVFARLMNVSANTVESWEQGVRRPSQATLKLLNIARKEPSALLIA